MKENRFYVTIIRGERVGFLAGPFKTKELADEYVEPARIKAIEFHAFASFDSFGVTRVEVNPNTPIALGVLNEHLGLKLVIDDFLTRH